MSAATDKLYAQTRAVVEAFKFDAEVANIFSDMIQRSVPGYPMMLEILGVITEKTVKPNSVCYDLGCSLGASTLAIRNTIHVPDCKIIAIDNSADMLQKCAQVVAQNPSATPVEIIEQDILQTNFQPCCLISMNLTLQFIRQDQRQMLLEKMAAALIPGGVLFLSEKIRFTDDDEQHLLTELHHQFKQHQGYSTLEIAQKRTAIENVLIPETLATHQQRLLDAGFSKVVTALQCFNFVSLIAYK